MCTRAGRIPPRARIAKASRQRRKRAEEAQENAKENAVRKSAATAEQGCGALASAAIEIIEHRALKPRRIPSRLRRERINFQRSLTELACANLSAARRRNARRMRPYPSVATTASVCARRGGMQGQFGTGTILIRRLEPQGEKSRGFSGHAFARVPVLEWPPTHIPADDTLDVWVKPLASPSRLESGTRRATCWRLLQARPPSTPSARGA